MNLKLLKSTREYLIQKNQLTIPFLRWSIKETRNFNYLSELEKREIILIYQALIEELLF